MTLKTNKTKPKNNPGFTIVELLIVIVIIGILAAITIVSYTGISKKAIESGQATELSDAKKQLELFNVEKGRYPDSIRCDIPDSDVNKCVKSSAGNMFTYSPNRQNNPTSYNLSIEKDNVAYTISNSTPPFKLIIDQPADCPTGFIPVPGSLTYATSGFCIMKYEAKQVGATNIPISTATGLPWVNISQTDAMANSENVAGCVGCHLITEAEWMTVAQNVLGVASNWSSGSVGSGYIYQGHVKDNPSIALSADINDSNGTYGETVVGVTAGTNSKRTLLLSNGETIWDLSGNVCEWTSGKVEGANQPGVDNDDSVIYEWPTVTNPGNLDVNPFPAATGLTGAVNWTSTNGIGKLGNVSTVDTGLYGFERGSYWGAGKFTGVLTLDIDDSPNVQDPVLGFRVVR